LISAKGFHKSGVKKVTIQGHNSMSRMLSFSAAFMRDFPFPVKQLNVFSRRAAVSLSVIVGRRFRRFHLSHCDLRLLRRFADKILKCLASHDI
jgi:hypothetical protein